MTALREPTRGEALDNILVGGLRALDITPAQRDRAVQYYEGFGTVLDERWTSTRGDNVVFAQGSFALGTVVRNFRRGDDIDIDIVAKRDVSRASMTQEQLKEEVGDAAKAYALTSDSEYPKVEESDRCWTLSWPGMHMDILPSIPDDERPYSDHLLITDKSVRNWQPSNPKGYATWFNNRSVEYEHQIRTFEAKTLDVEQVPDWIRRSGLQRVVQALKRHRDVYFAEQSSRRPSSIIITTLAAHAYLGGSDLNDAVRLTLSRMPNFIEQREGEWWLGNPAHEAENFLDHWEQEPWRRQYLIEWLEAASSSFGGLETKAGLPEALTSLGSMFGDAFTRGAGEQLGTAMTAARTGRRLSVNENGTLVAGAASAGLRPVKDHGFAGD